MIESIQECEGHIKMNGLTSFLHAFYKPSEIPVSVIDILPSLFPILVLLEVRLVLSNER